MSTKIAVMVKLTPEQVRMLDTELRRMRAESPQTLRITRSDVLRHAIAELHAAGKKKAA